MDFWASGVGGAKSRYQPKAAGLSYAEGVKQASRAESLKFAVFCSSEHHFQYNGRWGGALPSLAAVAVKTNTIGLAPATMLLPLNDPLRVAEDAALLDVICGGRLVLGFGYGYREMEFLGIGTEKKTRGARLVEQMELIRLALSQEVFSYHGKHYHYDNVRIRPRPIQQPPPMWLQAGTSTPAASRAGKAGFWYMAASPTLADFSDKVRRYRQAAAEAGVDASRLRIGMVKHIVIAGTKSQADQVRERLVSDTYYGEHMSAYGYLIDREGSHVFDEGRQSSVFEEWTSGIWTGTPDEAIKEYERYAALGVDTVLNVGAPGELFITQVLPHFTG